MYEAGSKEAFLLNTVKNREAEDWKGAIYFEQFIFWQFVFVKKPVHNIYLRELHSCGKETHRFLFFFKKVFIELYSYMILLNFASA